MTDRELLELAAKAAGYNLVWGDVYIVDEQNIDCTDLPYVRSNQQDGADWYWNPLEDDGDALRLAVKLHLTVDIDDEAGEAWVRKPWYADCEVTEPFGDDLFAATRRAIVRAAAAIQLSKEGK